MDIVMQDSIGRQWILYSEHLRKVEAALVKAKNAVDEKDKLEAHYQSEVARLCQANQKLLDLNDNLTDTANDMRSAAGDARADARLYKENMQALAKERDESKANYRGNGTALLMLKAQLDQALKDANEWKELYRQLLDEKAAQDRRISQLHYDQKRLREYYALQAITTNHTRSY